MGRYYSGDIEGKFWFGVQSSDDASFFGAEPSEPSFLSYCFTDDDIPSVKEGLAKCIAELGDYKEKLDEFFGEGGKGHNGYNDKMLAEHLGIAFSDDAVHNPTAYSIEQWYARHKLGVKILKQLEKTGECTFDADL